MSLKLQMHFTELKHKKNKDYLIRVHSESSNIVYR